MSNFLKRLVKPTDQNPDRNRQGFILNIILLGLITLTLVATIITFIQLLEYGSNFHGNSPFVMLFFFLFFSALFWLSKIGKSNIASYVIIFTLFLASTFTMISASTELPEGILLYALIIVMSGILVSTRFSLVMTTVLFIIYFSMSYFQVNNILKTDYSWRINPFTLVDVLVIMVTYGVILLISWLSNREIEKSLARARKSEADLKKERDQLEIKIEERTKELKETQLKQLSQMSHFAELGKLSSGIIHDLVNPITAVSLNLGQLKNIDVNEFEGVKVYLQQAIDAAKKMEKILTNVRKQISMSDVKNKFCPAKEIKDSIQVLTYKIYHCNVEIMTDLDTNLKVFGNNLKFSQIITNLISNSIDAFDEKAQKKEIHIKLYKKDEEVICEVADNGVGISEKDKGNIFEPFFTTKKFDKGTGLGLSIVKDAVENHFFGKISFDSDKNGTKFTISLPSE